MPLKAPPAPAVAAATWSGCYMGGNVGWIGSSDHYDLSMAGGFLDPINLFSNPANSAPLNHSYDPHSLGITGGAQVGCNYQTGAVVFGAEVDFDGSGLRDTINAAYGPGVIPPPFLPTAPHTESVTTDLDWFSTFRARLGFTPAPQWLLYVTGGGAVGRMHSNANINFGAVPGALLSGFPFNGSDTETRVGWTVGAGAEYAFGNNWSLKAEYLYLDFGSVNYLAVCPATAGFCATAPGQAPFAWNVHARMHDNVARVGLNYKFH